MTPLIMMYVYFDSDGNIKTISPDPVGAASVSIYSVSTFPLSEVESFLVGKKNPFDYYVKESKGIAGSTFKITKKQTIDVSNIRTLDAFLTEVGSTLNDSDTLVSIENNISIKQIKISINESLKNILNEDEPALFNMFANHPQAHLFFTGNGDPYNLLYSVIFSPRELIDNKIIEINYDVDLSAASLYTKKIINCYKYMIKD